MGDMELQIFADRLKELRQKLNITQKDFAERIGITAAALSSYENNLKNPSIAVAKRIAETFNVSIDWLCGLSNKMKNDDTPQTYADVIDLLVKAEDALKFKMDPLNTTCINFYDSVMRCFIHEWARMLPLYHSGTVDSKLYKLWLDDKKKEYADIHLGNTNEIEEFLSITAAIESANDPPQS